MKKITVFLLTFIMIFCCTACGAKTKKESKEDALDTPVQTPQDAITEAPLPEMDEDGYYLEDIYVEVSAQVANVRVSAEEGAPIFRMIDQGELIETNGYNDKWYRVVIEATNFYVSKDEVKPVTSAFGDADSINGLPKKIVIDPCNQLMANSNQDPVGPNSNQTKDGASPGSVGGLYGTRESQINLDYAVALRDELKARGYQVLLTREDNESADITNKQRAEFANASGATVWIRIQTSESTDPEMTGVMAMCISEKNPYHSDLYRDSYALAARMLQGVTQNIDVTNHGIYENDQMVAFNWSEIPVASFDIGFMSNATDEANMITDWYKESIVKGLADGIDYYFQ
ncbi:MAG: N-acetylmuramoyl-L-alanine amidase [Eubacteriales bacterium]|nr:N-acetylmuramoyl-L-alanine amidase [Eubacteriales bacterium]